MIGLGAEQRGDEVAAEKKEDRDPEPAGDQMLEPGVRDYEPPQALFGGTDGLDVYRRMLPSAPRFLAEGGTLYMECGPRNALELAGLAKRAFPAKDVEVLNDLAGRERMVVVA